VILIVALLLVAVAFDIAIALVGLVLARRMETEVRVLARLMRIGRERRWVRVHESPGLIVIDWSDMPSIYPLAAPLLDALRRKGGDGDSSDG
jgi:hypothetical protein